MAIIVTTMVGDEGTIECRLIKGVENIEKRNGDYYSENTSYYFISTCKRSNSKWTV